MNQFHIFNKLYVYLKHEGIEFSEEGFPVFREYMFTKEIPEEIFPFKNRSECKNKKKTALCTCQLDSEIYPKLNNLDEDLEEWKNYLACVVFDLSPRSEWRTEIQKFNICINQMAAIYLALHGVKLIGNLRIGSSSTLCSLKSYPQKSPFLIGTLGCTKNCISDDVFLIEMKLLFVRPSFVCIYGPLSKELEYILESYNIKYDVFKPRRELRFAQKKEVA